jgi:hypothetical protein
MAGGARQGGDGGGATKGGRDIDVHVCITGDGFRGTLQVINYRAQGVYGVLGSRVVRDEVVRADTVADLVHV